MNLIHDFEPFLEVALEDFPDVLGQISEVSEGRLAIYLVSATDNKPDKIRELNKAGEEIERVFCKKFMGRIFSLTMQTGPDFLGISRDFLGGHYYAIFVSESFIKSLHD